MPMPVARHRRFDPPKAPCSPACIRAKSVLSFQLLSGGDERNGETLGVGKRCSSTKHSPLGSSRFEVGAACDKIRKSCRPIARLRVCGPRGKWALYSCAHSHATPSFSLCHSL